MFKPKKEISIEIEDNEDEEKRKSTINRIELLILQLIEDINLKKYPKLSYSNLYRVNDDDIPKNSTQVVVNRNPGERLAENSREYLSNIPTSIDSSKSLSWVFGESENDEKKIQDDGVSREEEEEEEEEEKEEKEEEEEEEVASNLNNEEKELDDHFDIVKKNMTTIDFKRKNSRKNLILILTVMSHVHKMLINRETKNRRSLYYELRTKLTATLAPTQRFLDQAVNHVASILDRAPWELGFTATSKGLVCGDLSFIFSEKDFISCNIPGGLLIPQNINRISSIRTTAKLVLVVEKDSVFQKLLAEDCLNYLNCILITGKGYPDINTRMLVSILGDKLKIPIYILVDADPFGVEIMCTYRFGSAVRSREVEYLSCPNAKWIGVHPSEFSALGILPEIITAADREKIFSLQTRRYIDEKIFEQLKLMKNGKVEIEAVARLSSYRFLTTVYLSHKISAEEYF